MAGAGKDADDDAAGASAGALVTALPVVVAAVGCLTGALIGGETVGFTVERRSCLTANMGERVVTRIGVGVVGNDVVGKDDDASLASAVVGDSSVAVTIDVVARIVGVAVEVSSDADVAAADGATVAI
jgi:hypothetical protein